MGTTKVERARAVQSVKLRGLIAAFVESRGGWGVPSHDPKEPVREWVLPTTLGPLRVSIVNDWIACRFLDVTRARRTLGSGLHSRFNPHSGKWNWSCGSQAPADDTFRDWSLGVSFYLPATDLTTKAEVEAWIAEDHRERGL